MYPRELTRSRETNPTHELKIISASNVSHVNATNKMDVYAVISITGDNTQQTAKTPIDFNRGSNPAWNHTVKFPVSEEADHRLSTLKVKLFSYWLKDENDLYLGEVNVTVQELLALNPLPPLANGNNDQELKVTYPVKITGGITKGTLSLSYRFLKPEVGYQMYPSAPDYSLLFDQPDYPNPDPTISGQSIMQSSQFQTVITKLTLELVIKSAKDIKNISIRNGMNVYASVMIRESKETTKDRNINNTSIANCAYGNPRWDHEVKISLDEKLVQEGGGLTLVVKLIVVRPILGDKDVGEIKVPVHELFGSYQLTNNDNNDMTLVTRGLTGSTGEKPKGTLSFTYRFLREQVLQPFIHGTSSCAIGQPEANVGSSNSHLPIYMPPQYHQPQPQIRTSSENFGHFMPQIQPYHSHEYQQYSPSQPQLQSRKEGELDP